MLGRGDWDYFHFIHEVANITTLSYSQFPFWNPYYCGGLSLIGNPQSRFLSPSFLFTSTLGVVNGLKVEIIFHFFIALLGMYFLSGHYKIPNISRVIAATIFAFNGAFVLHITEGDMVWLPIVYLPYVFLFFLKSLKSHRFIVISAIFLALMLYEGGTYVLNFSILFLGLYCVFHSLQSKSLGAIKNLIVLLLLFILFSGPKLFPTLELLRSFPVIRNPGGPTSFKLLFDIFLDPYQYMNKDPVYGWWGFGAYIGIFPVLCYLHSFRLFKTQWPLICTSLLLLLVGFGNFAKFSPWYILNKFPVFSSMWVPSRVFVVFIFAASILIGLNLKEMYLKDINRNRKLIIYLFILAAVGTYLNLLAVNGRIFFEIFRPYHVRESYKIRWGNANLKKIDFSQREFPENSQFRFGAWSAMYSPLLSNKGIVDFCYEPIPVTRSAISDQNPNYKGEFYLLKNNGTASLKHWSPNKIVYRVALTQPDTLIINQNYEKNWKSDAPRKPRDHNGLLAQDLSPDDQEITIYYFPNSFLLGCVGMLSGILISCRIWRIK